MRRFCFGVKRQPRPVHTFAAQRQEILAGAVRPRRERSNGPPLARRGHVAPAVAALLASGVFAFRGHFASSTPASRATAATISSLKPAALAALSSAEAFLRISSLRS